MKRLGKVFLAIFLLVPMFVGAAFLSQNLAFEAPQTAQNGGGGANSLDSSNSAGNSDFDGDKNDIDTPWTTPTYKTYDDYFADYNISAATITEHDLTGKGSANDPYIVHSTRGFLWVTNQSLSQIYLSNKYMELACDVYLNDEKIDNDGNISGGDGIVYNWKSCSAYNLVFNGNNFCIYGLYFDKNGTCASLFGSNNLLEVKNLNFSDFYIYSTEYNASLLAYYSKTITNCRLLRGKVSADKGNATGFVHTAGYISNCQNYSNIYCEGDTASGFATKVDVGIQNCDNFGDVNVSQNYAGGILSSTSNNKIVIENCNNFGDITAQRYSGGILPANYSTKNSFSVVNCKNYGYVTGTLAGGILGYSCGICSISGCENYGKIEGVGYSTGGILGYIYDNEQSRKVAVTIRDCKSYSQGRCRAIVGLIVGYSKLSLTNCYLELENYSEGSGVMINSIEQVKVVEISNVYIKMNNSVKDVVPLCWTVTNRNGKISFENIYVENDNDARFSIIESFVNADLSLVSFENSILVNNNQCFYYGSDFSGFYVDFKSGKMGLKSLSGRGFYQGKVTEEYLLNRGYTKKEI